VEVEASTRLADLLPVFSSQPIHPPRPVKSRPHRFCGAFRFCGPSSSTYGGQCHRSAGRSAASRGIPSGRSLAFGPRESRIGAPIREQQLEPPDWRAHDHRH